MAKANSVCSTSDARLEELEAPICAVIDMAGLCVIAFDYCSGELIPDGAYIRVDRTTWGLLGFGLRHQQELAKTLLVSFEARVDGELSS